MRFAFSIIAALIASAVASNVLDLSEEADFEKSIGQGVPALVELYDNHLYFFECTTK